MQQVRSKHDKQSLNGKDFRHEWLKMLNYRWRNFEEETPKKVQNESTRIV